MAHGNMAPRTMSVAGSGCPSPVLYLVAGYVATLLCFAGHIRSMRNDH